MITQRLLLLALLIDPGVLLVGGVGLRRKDCEDADGEEPGGEGRRRRGTYPCFEMDAGRGKRPPSGPRPQLWGTRSPPGHEDAIGNCLSDGRSAEQSPFHRLQLRQGPAHPWLPWEGPWCPCGFSGGERGLD